MRKISILIPIYNVERYIERCAKSLFEQTYENIEYIFVNDCSKDNSIGILYNVIKQYPNRVEQVKVINHEKNAGLGGARLTGINNATGDYIWCVDSDDWVEKDSIEKINPFIEDDYDYIVFNYYEERTTGATKFYNKELSVNNVLYGAVSPSIWKCLVKRSLYFDNNIMPVVGINHSEDFLLTARLILVARKPILLPNLFLYHYNLTNISSYCNNINIKSLESTANANKIVMHFYESQKQLKKYSICMAVSLAKCVMVFNKVDPNNRLKLELLKYIKHLDKIIYLFVYLHPNVAMTLIRAYKKIKVR